MASLLPYHSHVRVRYLIAHKAPVWQVRVHNHWFSRIDILHERITLCLPEFLLLGFSIPIQLSPAGAALRLERTLLGDQLVIARKDISSYPPALAVSKIEYSLRGKRLPEIIAALKEAKFPVEDKRPKAA